MSRTKSSGLIGKSVLRMKGVGAQEVQRQAAAGQTIIADGDNYEHLESTQISAGAATISAKAT